MVGMRTGWMALFVLALGAACAAPGEAPAGNGEPALLTSVQATTLGDRVRFVLQVTNAAEAPVTLEFGSGQSFDFVVTREGREVWRWSADQMFTQALRTVTLRPGETRSFEAAWAPPAGAEGEYQVTGVLTAREHRVEQTTRFRVP